MSSFKNFANERSDDGLTQGSTSIRYKQSRDTRVGSRIEKVWATDFERCESREDYEKYIFKYGKYQSNKYISQAQAKIESFDAEESERIEREKVARRVQNTTAVPTYDFPNNGYSTKSNILNTCFKALVWMVIIAGVGGISYYQYQQKQKEETANVIVAQPTNPQNTQDVQEYPATHTHSEQISEQENTIFETEPQEIWWDCTICGATGRCQLCFGTGRCGVCGGGGSLYRSSGWIDCGNCGGSGWCPSCEGSGFCFACKGSGKCKLED